MKGNHLCSERNMLTLSLLGSTLRPVISSVIITPRLYTSAIFEGLPPLSYSGAQYPLKKNTAHLCICSLWHNQISVYYMPVKTTVSLESRWLTASNNEDH